MTRKIRSFCNEDKLAAAAPAAAPAKPASELDSQGASLSAEPAQAKTQAAAPAQDKPAEPKC